MPRDAGSVFCRLRRAGCVAVLLAGLLGAPASAQADDVPEQVRAAYTAGNNLYREGGRGNLEKAFRLLNTRKDEALDSVDYWELYARVWLGLGKVPRYLWDKTIGPRQGKAPDSPVFDLVRARIEKDLAEKRRHIESALKRKPDSLRARAMLALLLLDEEKEDEADAVLQKILEEDPQNARALVGKARLALSDGLAREALELLDKALAQHESARLYHLKSLAYRRLAQSSEEEGLLEKALAAAGEAVGREPIPRHIENYDELLKETGDALAAAKALRGHFERTEHPLLGALLAKSAFEAGDYETAVLGLSAAEEEDLRTLKARAEAFARLGKGKEARRATKQILKLDSQGVLFAARLELFLGDTKAAEKLLGSLADVEAKRLLVRIHAWAGRPKEITELLGAEARKGSRRGEDVLLAHLQAVLVERMGKRAADDLREKLLEARWQAASGPVAQAEGGGGDLGQVKTEGWARRAVSYWRAPCGLLYQASDGQIGGSITMGDGEVSAGRSVEAETSCEEHKTATFRFNAVKKKNLQEALQELVGGGGGLGDFKPAEEAFAAGCSAWVSGNGAEAVAKFDAALAVEPGFHRARIFRAVMSALADDGKKKDAAKEAGEAAKAWPADFEARRLVIFLRAWAGDAKLGEEIQALAAQEARYNERDLDAL